MQQCSDVGELDRIGGEPLAGSGFESEPAEADFAIGPTGALDPEEVPE